MLYVLNTGESIRHFVEEESLEEFSFKIIKQIREINPQALLKVNYGYDNIRIEDTEIKNTIWIYNKEHPIFQNALIDLKTGKIELLKVI